VSDVESSLAEKFASVLPHLNERQRRLVVAAEARAVGRGGVSVASRASGLSRPTVYQGLAELAGEVFDPERVRAAGGGRKKVADTDPRLLVDLERLVDPATWGDPSSPLRWTTKSTRTLARALAGMGHAVSHVRVGELLHELHYSLQANAKVIEGGQHADRDAQFGYINARVRAFLRRRDPVISVDCKKKELVGNYANAGRQWRRHGQPERVKVHDFKDKVLGKVVPYGVYDLGRNHGWVEVGVDHETATFAVAAIRAWWRGDGISAYPQAKRLLVTADAGGANSYRSNRWKKELATLATDTGLAITVCHFPPGTSKWNRIEHRLFAAISTNWRGHPLTSHEVIVNLIGATTNSSGLTVHAELDTHAYPKGIEVSNDEVDALPLTRHKFHPEWNYTLRPNQRHK
jgi:Rhodopirellula transposase DDE domain